MFWKRKVIRPIGFDCIEPIVNLTPPARKEFETMLEILKDAEKYDNNDEKELSDSMLTNLCEFIDRYKQIK